MQAAVEVKRRQTRLRKRAYAMTCVLALFGLGASAQAADGGLTVATGTPGRAYHGIGERLREVGRERALPVTVVASDGSVDNLRRLADDADPVNVALTQADALHDFMAGHPGFGTEVKIMESLGPECVFAVTAADSEIQSLSDWQRATGPRVVLPAPDSGVAETHRIMAGLMPELADDKPLYLDASQAIAALHGAGPGPAEGQADLVFTVHRAKFRGPELTAALEQPDQYSLIPIEDKRLSVKLPDGTPVYQSIDLPLVRGSAAGNRSVRTICMKGLLVAAPAKLGPDAEAKLQQIIDYDWMRVYPEEP